MASRNVWPNNGPQRYRKRRPLPALILILVLGVTATVVWINVMTDAAENAGATRCEPPAPRKGTEKPTTPPTTLGQQLEFASLDRTVPAPPGQVLVKVSNASSQRGAAGIVTARLRELGFAKVADPGNDPLYGDTMECRGQIRFGPQGTSSARTLSLLDPCVELIRDERKDATVDLVIGADFDALTPNSQARTALEQLTQWAEEHPETKGGLQANGPQPDLDPELLAGARSTRC
ncbi:envelope integrity protein Cei [Actinophytocola gossypii]|uniref:Envelope integrity protein Cei n=1 Tax=Actinophytocola gossypii TaxID=2812003 RepID=A0ABT2J8U0_9PSEU|nr:envelope integrity protein Cei [Actinophytocola gossypii]MCT2583984.1 envelope integrity protein Cei [Actinophytocola gossypii]